MILWRMETGRETQVVCVGVLYVLCIYRLHFIFIERGEQGTRWEAKANLYMELEAQKSNSMKVERAYCMRRK